MHHCRRQHERCAFRWPRCTRVLGASGRTSSRAITQAPRARAAIVTTLREIPAPMLASWTNWHLRLGFARLFLYFDDPEDGSILEARRIRREAIRSGHPSDCICIVVCDDRLRSEWSALETASRWELPKVWHHVEVRQLLNVEHALRRAHTDADVDWLLHIDSDEVCPRAFSAKSTECRPFERRPFECRSTRLRVSSFSTSMIWTPRVILDA